jgi:hypothetical protein
MYMQKLFPESENPASELFIQSRDSISPVSDRLDKGVLMGVTENEDP